ENGYRYYSAAQLDDLDTILIMKKIGLSLKEIKEHMMHHTAKETVKIFREQITKIENEIEELMLIDHRLRHRTRQLEGALQRK
ncbi:MerR family DNA-binding protein, partial [Acinetobacter soli]|uniref:MerR family DNA-binding protein n=1 Tax=Acinetobacter soli TaxID=487316 RepID=UPI0028131C5C